MTYGKDMQEDKEGTFDALANLSLCVAAMAGMVRDMTPDAASMKRAAGAGHATATDLADWLVRKLGIPFREAHHITGRIVSAADREGAELRRLPLEAMREIEPRIDEDVFSVLSVERSVRSRKSYGGTAPGEVRKQARRWLLRLRA
jgi:argininosuccinate lyase